MPTNYTTFDALIDGRLRAVLHPDRSVTLWFLGEDKSELLATFLDVDQFCPLVGGWPDAIMFNTVMAIRRGEETVVEEAA